LLSGCVMVDQTRSKPPPNADDGEDS
jgi:hypothetical protein